MMYVLLLGTVVLATGLTFVSAHAFIYKPPQRGLLNGASAVIFPVVDPKAPIDWSPHFPAGDKGQEPGSGLRSQKLAAGPKGWTPFEPSKLGFVWRAGVCGDLKNGSDHLQGGKFYYGGKIVATYSQGGIVDVDVAVITHHNGYMELHVCDVKRCNGEISEDCFRKGACVRLNRTWDRSCESRTDQLCAPRDPKYPSRWYLPCSRASVDLFGEGKMRFKLPPQLSCEHCVFALVLRRSKLLQPAWGYGGFSGASGT